jgi:hypothetical protein
MKKTIAHADKNPKELHPVLTEFKEMVENDSRLYMIFNTMFEQVTYLLSVLRRLNVRYYLLDSAQQGVPQGSYGREPSSSRLSAHAGPPEPHYWYGAIMDRCGS